MKKSIKTTVVMTVIMAISTLFAPGCKKNTTQTNGGVDPALISLLVGSPGEVWQLHDGNYQVWSYGFLSNSGWVEQTLATGTYLFSNCVVNNNFMTFYADGTSMQSNYTCDINAPTNTVFSKGSGSSGTWSLGSDNVTLTGSFSKYLFVKLISVTNADLYLGTSDGTFHFVKANSMPYLNNTQFLSGAGSKVWKYNTSAIGTNRVIQPLTAAEAATRLTFNADGTLIKSYTDLTYGQPVTGTWTADAFGGSYTYTFPAVGSSAAINESARLWELTNTSFTYSYVEASNNYQTTINLVPQ